MAWFVHDDCIKKTGDKDKAIGWAIATFFFGIIVLVIYFLLGDSITGHISGGPLVCPQCSKENISSSKICQFCGHRFAQNDLSKSCPECERQFRSDANFCPHCAVELVNSPPNGIDPDNTYMRSCPSCGKKNMTHRTECWNCQTPLD